MTLTELTEMTWGHYYRVPLCLLRGVHSPDSPVPRTSADRPSNRADHQMSPDNGCLWFLVLFSRLVFLIYR
jgi:hypothetical protein